mgnify:CR=1 FL=1
MRIPIDDCILSCAEIAEQAYHMMIDFETKDDENSEKMNKICAMLAVLAATLDDLTERVSEEKRTIGK